MLTGIGTAALAVGAIVTAILAYMAFRKQSREVRAIESQVADGQELTRQQGKLIQIQSDHVTVLREQLGSQREATAQQAASQAKQVAVLQAQLDSQRIAAEKQAEVLELQAAELRESLAERKREAEDRLRGQAACVTAWLDHRELPSVGAPVGAVVANASGQPVFDVRVFFHQINRRPGEDWVPVVLGSPPPDQTLPVIPAGTEHFVPMPVSLTRMFGDIPVNPATVIVSVEFTDTAGNRWERDPRGALNVRS
jgi:hypothetical protein